MWRAGNLRGTAAVGSVMIFTNSMVIETNFLEGSHAPEHTTAIERCVRAHVLGGHVVGLGIVTNRDQGHIHTLHGFVLCVPLQDIQERDDRDVRRGRSDDSEVHRVSIEAAIVPAQKEEPETLHPNDQREYVDDEKHLLDVEPCAPVVVCLSAHEQRIESDDHPDETLKQAKEEGHQPLVHHTRKDDDGVE